MKLKTFSFLLFCLTCPFAFSQTTDEQYAKATKLISGNSYSYTFSQNNDEQYAKALKLKMEYKYKEAFPLFQALLKTDSNNVNYLQGASYCYSKYGYYYAEESAKMGYYKTAENLALRAIQK